MEKVQLFESLLKRDLALRVRVTGNSMWPFLHGNDVATIARVLPDLLKKGDMVLFRANGGGLVLHRIIALNRHAKGGLIVQTHGDAVKFPDSAVNAKQILGKVCMVERPGLYGKIRRKNMEFIPCRTTSRIMACYLKIQSKLFDSHVLRLTMIPQFIFFFQTRFIFRKSKPKK